MLEMHRSVRVRFGGEDIILDAAGVALIPARQTLIVADLHLEKGSASRGRFVPALDSLDTLQRLARCIDRHKPARVVCLGDSFQDKGAGARMREEDRALFNAICARVPEWVWIAGNHDPEMPGFCPGLHLDALTIGRIRLAHQPASPCGAPQIVGHFHPRAAIKTGVYRVSGPCFSLSDRLLILPAFGAYTGGLRCTDPAIRDLHDGPQRAFMLHNGKVWPLPRA
jgi:DNA ligase-associated metallophosphoesterase